MISTMQRRSAARAAHTFLATISQYGFLVSCESRISLTNSGPYRVDDRHQLVVRDFMDLAECSLPGSTACGRRTLQLPDVPTLVRDCRFRLVDDWGSFEATPEFTAEHLAGIGLYTRTPCRKASCRWHGLRRSWRIPSGPSTRSSRRRRTSSGAHRRLVARTR